ncbi:enoyl-CoA hydratase/isomerase family protein [uncultured Reyranella sp.]|uniref:enoyl-CoA hydratase/isomerase family protein n=1 Tax=uncultured Reyranella sp. TaxID=735512 RepID=UPI00259D0A48|nr:enoyl-CoA hydratase/isomerase family protein [uncultured Reyranella sp.]
MSFVERQDRDGIAGLRLSSGRTNALTADAVRDLIGALDDAGKSARAVVLAGGDRFFCNGLDLGWALSRDRGELRSFFLTLAKAVTTMLTLPVPIVGAVRGHAVGAGKTLFISCDHRIAATGRTLLGSPEVKLGVPNPLFADALLRKLVSDPLANDLLYNGALLPAESLVGCGLVQEVASPGEVEDRAWRVAGELGARPRAAFAASKAMRAEDFCHRLERSLPREIEILLDCWFGDEAQRLLRAAAAPRA